MVKEQKCKIQLHTVVNAVNVILQLSKFKIMQKQVKRVVEKAKSSF